MHESAHRNSPVTARVQTVANASRHYVRAREGFFAAPTLPGFVRIIKAVLELRTAFGDEESRPVEFAFNIYLLILKFASEVRTWLRKLERVLH